jgi:hypothetical protein
MRRFVALLLATGFVGALAAPAVAEQSPPCAGLPPSCHVGQIAICISPDIYDSHAYWACVRRP